jgi:cytochrome c oxidase subunit I
MPRRYADYLPTDGFTTLNTISTIGSFVLGASMIPFAWNIYRSYRYGEIVTADDPWGFGNSLEWATSSPPPRHNFTYIPRIRSERPAFEYHYPHMIERLDAEAHAGRRTRLGTHPAAGGGDSLDTRRTERDPDPGSDGAR